MTDCQAMAWITARLADALDHAQCQNVIHGDVKPSNILLTADGNPMLLDFNLARNWSLEEAGGPLDEMGGTLAYMAPSVWTSSPPPVPLLWITGARATLTCRRAKIRTAATFIPWGSSCWKHSRPSRQWTPCAIAMSRHHRARISGIWQRNMALSASAGHRPS